MSSDDKYRSAAELFEQALDLPEEERESFVRSSAGANASLCEEVLSLLGSHRSLDTRFLDPAAGPAPLKADAWVGATLGNYQIQSVIAEGGMGVVYRATQENPKREVALKLIRGGLVSEELLKRFSREAEVLGRLSHPGIAHVYEAATAETERGTQPFFAMELIEGVPLDRYVATASPSMEQRIRIVIAVAEAIQHAHERDVVHRDLKPGNILIDANGVPHVVDFGVARVLRSDVDRATLQTDAQMILGTLAYMSPEQVRSEHEAITPRSDVYSLGAVAYELFSGRLPHDVRGANLVEAARRIEQDDPSTMSGEGNRFDADLETIVGKCLEKEPQRRYASVGELAHDLKRYLEDEPIQARPPGTLYLLSKFAKRNRALVTGVVFAFVALSVGLAVAIAGWADAARERQLALIEAEKANALSGFLQQMMRAPDPWAEGADVKVIEILAQAGGEIDEQLGEFDEVAAKAHQALGTSYFGLGMSAEAQPHFENELALSEAAWGETDPRLIEPLRNLAEVHSWEGRTDEAAGYTERAMELAAGLDALDPLRLEAVHAMGLIHEARGELEEAATLFGEAARGSEAVHGARDDKTLTSLSAMGTVLQQLKRLDEARPALEQAYEGRLEESGPDHPATLSTLNNLAFVYQGLEQHDLALEMFTRSLEARHRVFGGDTTSVLVGENNLALQYGMMQRYEDAVPHHLEAIRIADLVHGDRHWILPAAQATYGKTLIGLERYADAEQELQAAHDGLVDKLGVEHWRSQRVIADLATLYRTTGDENLAISWEKKLIEN